MKKMYIYTFKNCTPNCNLLQFAIAENDGAICNVLPLSLARRQPSLFAAENEFIKKETSLIKRAAEQMNEYFNKQRKLFDLPLKPAGTDFQLKVWKALLQIPYGETCSYGEIAAAVGNPKASRAVGTANNKNPIHIIIPCHRVIGANGSLTGYAGGLKTKQMLLKLERS